MADSNLIAAIGSLLQGVGTTAGALAVAGAAWFGSRTFENWRKERLSERRIEQAERILTATYKVRRGLSDVRSPAIFIYQFDDAVKKLKEAGEWEHIPEPRRGHLLQTQVYWDRLAATKDERLALEECQPMARALFGERLERAIEELNRQASKVQVYVDSWAGASVPVEGEMQEKINAAIWEGHPTREKNEIDQTIAAQVKIIEDVCLPVLRLENDKRKRS